VEGHHLVVHQVAGRLQAATLRVHKVVQVIVHVRKVLEVADQIVLVRLGQEYPNLRRTVAVALFHREPQWAVPVIPRVFVHELLNR